MEVRAEFRDVTPSEVSKQNILYARAMATAVGLQPSRVKLVNIVGVEDAKNRPVGVVVVIRLNSLSIPSAVTLQKALLTSKFPLIFLKFLAKQGILPKSFKNKKNNNA